MLQNSDSNANVIFQTLLAVVMFGTMYWVYLQVSQPVADFLDSYSQVSHVYRDTESFVHMLCY